MTRRLLACAAVVSFAMAPPARAAAVSSFYGRWTITGIAGYGDVSSGEADAATGLNKPVVLTSTGIELPDDPCDKHRLAYGAVAVDAFLRDRWQTSRSALDLGSFRLGKTAPHIDAGCADALVLDRDHLLVTSGAGALYIVERDKAGAP